MPLQPKGGGTGSFSSGNDTSWIEGFAKSTFESIPEVFGITPSMETLEWRQDNPISAFAGEVLGMAVPYVGYFKFLQPTKYAKAVARIGDAVNKPITTGMKRGVAALAPAEAGRTAISQVIGDNPLQDELAVSLTNLALSGGIGGLIGGVAAGGLRDPKLSTIFQGLDMAAPYSLQARHMKGLLDKGTVMPELMPKAQLAFNDMMKKARLEELPSNSAYVTQLARATRDQNVGRLRGFFNRFFRPTEKINDGKTIQVRKFAEAVDKDYPTSLAWTKELKNAGLADDFPLHGQYFRTLTFDPGAKLSSQAKMVDNMLTNNMASIGNNWFLSREVDDGMFILAKKYAGKPGAAKNTDKWLMFKTDSPGKFVPKADAWSKSIVALHKWIPQANLAGDYGIVGNTVKGAILKYPFRTYQSLGEPGRIKKTIDKIMPKNVVGQKSELVSRLGETIKGAFAPTNFQFRKSPRGNWIINMARIANDAIETTHNEIMNGVMKVDPGKQLLFPYLRNQASGPLGFKAVRELVMGIPEAEWQEMFHPIWRKLLKPDSPEFAALYKSGKISDQVAEAASQLDRVKKWMETQINKAEIATGNKATMFPEGNYNMGHYWEGDTRIILKNGDQIGAIVGGPNKRAAQQSAQRMLKENPTWVQGETFSVSELVDKAVKGHAIPKELKPAVNNPTFVLETQDVRGFRWDDVPFTREEFIEAYEHNLRSQLRYQANITARQDMLLPALNRLQADDPVVYKQVVARLNDFEGTQSKWGKMQNAFTDRVLAPMLGQNSATKIVAYTNTAMFNFTLGAMNLVYPAANAITFLQTVNPETAFIMSAPEARLMGDYTFFAAGGTKGPVGSVGVLQPLKISGRALGEMRKPSPELTNHYERATNERILTPLMVENYVGEAATQVADLGKVLKEGAGFSSWLRALSEWLPAHSERFARGHAFTVGHIIARDYLKRAAGTPLTQDEIFQFAKQFTEKTMYMYGAADKPRIFTTPAGSLMGLFKNWMFNYMGQMVTYSKEAALHNNWSPLMWQTAGTFATGGLAATPLYQVANGFSELWADKSILQWSYDEFGDGADGLLYGLPAGLTGVSLYSQVATPMANPMRDASAIFSAALYGRMVAAGRAISGGAFDHWQATGEHPAKDPLVRMQLARAFAPNTIYRAMQSFSGPDIVSPTTGYPFVKDVPTYARILNAAGFHPVELDKAFAVSEELWKDKNTQRAQVAKLGEAFFHAQQVRDNQQMNLIVRQATVWGLDVSSVLRSAMVRQRKAMDDLVHRDNRPAAVQVYENVIGDEDED